MRSRSPLKRQVRFASPLTSEVPEDAGKAGLMRMKDAREAVPRLENESRTQWKNRIFQHKRKEEEKSGVVAKSKGKGSKK